MSLRRLVGCAFLVSSVHAAWPAIAQAQPPAVVSPPPPVETAPPATYPAPTPPPPPPAGGNGNGTKTVAVEFTSLRLLLSKGVITQAEYDSALRDLGETSGMKAGDGNTFVLGRWATTLYGFLEGDTIYDSTQSLNEIAGNTQIARPETYPGSHDRAQFSVRNSRLGLRLKAPEVNGIRVSGQLEMDFLGTQPGFGGAPGANTGTESSFFNNPLLRVRHANFKVETPVLDLLIGQYWILFGWQGQYLPASVEIQGIPGEIFSRQMQVRLSKTVKTDAVTFEAAIAAVRPPQRNSAIPAGQAGLRFAVNKWTAPQTLNFAGTQIQPLSIAVTGDMRSIRLPEFSAEPKTANQELGTSIAVEAFIPVVPGTKDTKGNSLALSGEVSTGYGSADMYTGLTGGVTNPALPPPATPPKPGTATPAYAPDVDAGIAYYDKQGQMHLVNWTGLVAGIQYYFPGSGALFATANYSRVSSSNAGSFSTAATKTRQLEEWFDFNLFWDATSAFRLGAEYANFKDTYNDSTSAKNERVQVSGLFLF